MARLPTVGGDSGDWGDVLNEFLATSHNTDGSIKDVAISSYVNSAISGAAGGQEVVHASSDVSTPYLASLDDIGKVLVIACGDQGSISLHTDLDWPEGAWFDVVNRVVDYEFNYLAIDFVGEVNLTILQGKTNTVIPGGRCRLQCLGGTLWNMSGDVHEQPPS